MLQIYIYTSECVCVCVLMMEKEIVYTYISFQIVYVQLNSFIPCGFLIFISNIHFIRQCALRLLVNVCEILVVTMQYDNRAKTC